MKTKTKFIFSILSFVLFAVLIVLVKKVDVADIGPEGTSIGLSGMNKGFHDMTGYSNTLFKLTEYLGYAALVIVGVFGILGLVQLIQRKSLLKVDRAILLLGGLYIVVFGLYFFFDKVAINYRPMIMEGDLHVESSFPSSHTVLACVVLGSAILMVKDYIRKDELRMILEFLMVAMMVMLAVGRLLSGVHWLTDIISGVLLSCGLLFLFAGLKDKVKGEE